MRALTKNAAIYTVGAAVTALLELLGTALLTRLLPPGVYASYGLLVSFGACAVTLLSLGLDAAYVRFYYTSGQSRGCWLVRCLSPSLVPLVVLAIALLHPRGALSHVVFGEVLPQSCLWVLLLYIALSLLHRFAQAKARMEERPWRFALSAGADKAVFLLVALLLTAVASRGSLLSLALSLAVGVLCALAVHAVPAKGAVPTSGAPVALRDMLGYGLPYMINNLLLLLVPLCERTLLRTLGSADALGVYTAAAVFGMPALLLTGVLDSLWNPLMLQHCGERDRFGCIIHDVGLGVTHLLCLGVAACILLRRVAALLLGAAYRDAAAVAPALLLCAGLGAVALIYGSGINILRKTSYHVAAALLQLTVSVLFCCLLVPLHGARGAAIAALLGSLAGRLLRMAVGLHLYGTGRREYGSLALLLFSVLAAVVAALHTSPAADLCVGGVLLCLALPSAVGQARVLLLRRRPAKEESV